MLVWGALWWLLHGGSQQLRAGSLLLEGLEPVSCPPVAQRGTLRGGEVVQEAVLVQKSQLGLSLQTSAFP